MRLYKIVADTYEKASYPVVTHIFLGKTKKEAWGYFKAHLTTDSFFKDCTEQGRFSDFECPTKVHEGWVDGRRR